MRLLFSALAAVLPTLGLADTLSRDPVVITTTPVLIERMPDGQHLNFDLTVANGSEEAIDIDRIELSVFNRECVPGERVLEIERIDGRQGVDEGAHGR